MYGGTKAFVQQFSPNLRSGLHGTGVCISTIDLEMVEMEVTLVRTRGDQNASDTLYGYTELMTAAGIAATISRVASLQPHLSINQLELMPVTQSYAGFQVFRLSN